MTDDLSASCADMLAGAYDRVDRVIDLNKPRARSAMAAVVSLSAAPGGFTVGDLDTILSIFGAKRPSHIPSPGD